MHTVLRLRGPVVTNKKKKKRRPRKPKKKEGEASQPPPSVPISYNLANYLGLEYKPYHVYPWTEVRDMILQVLRTHSFPDFQDVRQRIYEERHWPTSIYLDMERAIHELENESFRLSFIMTSSAVVASSASIVQDSV